MIFNVKQYDGLFGCTTCKHPGVRDRDLKSRIYEYTTSKKVTMMTAVEPLEAATVSELRWLKCRRASIKGLKNDLVDRCKIYSADPTRANNVIDPDVNDAAKIVPQ
ncbi:hypothetical protein AC249_AIPGENE11004 [Exaiptasia diaphana]|nr:hypothetical protein AC249_AIPGENE11004 [Exaiptasia diaphana]